MRLELDNHLDTNKLELDECYNYEFDELIKANPYKEVIIKSSIAQ